jgi:hypothetical protein
MEPKPPVKLFHVDDDTYLSPNPNVVPLVINCMPYVRSKMDESVSYISHPIYGDGAMRGDKWPTSTNIVCMHDCHSFTSIPVPIVRRFDEDKKLYFVYGVFCSANCAKAYIIEHDQGITTRCMMAFNHMIRNVFHLTGPIKPAPPRFRLCMFGGDLSIDAFRNNFKEVLISVLNPPFVPAEMIFKLEPSTVPASVTEADMYATVNQEGPPSTTSTGMYDTFLADTATQSVLVPTKTTQAGAAGPKNSNTTKKRSRKKTTTDNLDNVAVSTTYGSLNSLLTFK